MNRLRVKQTDEQKIKEKVIYTSLLYVEVERLRREYDNYFWNTPEELKDRRVWDKKLLVLEKKEEELEELMASASRKYIEQAVKDILWKVRCSQQALDIKLRELEWKVQVYGVGAF